MQELALAIGQILPYITSPAAPTQWVYAYPGGSTPAPQPTPQSYPAGAPHPQSYPAGALQPPYASRPGTPTPPPPASYPGGGSQPPYASRSGAPATPVPPPGTPVPPPPGFAPAKSPTTLGASNGQVAPRSVSPAPRPRTFGWVLATALALGGVGAVIAVVMTRDGGRAAAHDPGSSSPAVPDAAQAVIPPAPADAAVAVAVTPDAAIPDAAAPVPVDAAVDAPGKRPHRPRPPAVPHAGSGSSTTPPGCDRSIDTDCDGIPDVR
jgi:hypothetical protein